MWNTSEEADVFRFDSVYHEVIVKFEANEGIFTLRSAVDEINCSDLHTVVLFEIEDPAPYEIVLQDSLATLNAWRGATLNALKTQQAFLTRESITANAEVTVDGSAFVDRALFHLANTQKDGWVNLANMTIRNTVVPVRLTGNGNKLDSLQIIDELNVAKDTAIVVAGSVGNSISNSRINGYELGVFIADKATSNGVYSTTFEAVDTAISITGSANQSRISSNQFNYNAIGISIDGPKKSNIISENTFGSAENPVSSTAIALKHTDFQFIANNHFPRGQANLTDTTIAFISIGDSSNNNQLSANRFGILTSGLVEQESNMIGVYIGTGLQEYLLNNVIVKNDFAGLTVPAVVVHHAEGGSISGNFFGIDSAAIKRGQDRDDFALVTGIAASAIVIDTSLRMDISSNKIINYKDYGIAVKNSDFMTISRNQILSEKSINKGIQLYLDTNDESNQGIKAPSIDTNDVVSKTRIKLEGSAIYPNCTVHLYEGYQVGLDTTEQSLRFIKDITADSEGNWTTELPSSNFGFSVRNKYIAQVTNEGRSSEFSKLYTVQSLLCKLKTNKISLLEDFYDPCPGSNFAIDAQLDGLTYVWDIQYANSDTIIDTRIA